ncbi:hypothetical protein Tco_0165844, partial [Tanacetum coccineum]
MRTSSNLRNQETIQDGRVTVQSVQGRQSQGYANNGARGNVTATRGSGYHQKDRKPSQNDKTEHGME